MIRRKATLMRSELGQLAVQINSENPGIRQIVDSGRLPPIRIGLDRGLVQISAIAQSIDGVLLGLGVSASR